MNYLSPKIPFPALVTNSQSMRQAEVANLTFGGSKYLVTFKVHDYIRGKDSIFRKLQNAFEKFLWFHLKVGRSSIYPSGLQIIVRNVCKSCYSLAESNENYNTHHIIVICTLQKQCIKQDAEIVSFGF